jgi:hypothetical protein
MLTTVILSADVHNGLHIAQFGIGFRFITDTTPHWLSRRVLGDVGRLGCRPSRLFV